MGNQRPYLEFLFAKYAHFLPSRGLVCLKVEKDGSMLLLLNHFSHVRLCCNPIDGSPPGSPIPGILQARTLEWVAISFSNAWKWKVKVKSLSRVRLFATPWNAYQAPPPMGFSRQEYWSGLPFPSLGLMLQSPKAMSWHCHDLNQTNTVSQKTGKFWKRLEYQTTWPASSETYMQVRKQPLELDTEQQTGSK